MPIHEMSNQYTLPNNAQPVDGAGFVSRMPSGLDYVKTFADIDDQKARTGLAAQEVGIRRQGLALEQQKFEADERLTPLRKEILQAQAANYNAATAENWAQVRGINATINQKERIAKHALEAAPLLSALDPSAPDFSAKAWGIVNKYPGLIQDPGIRETLSTGIELHKLSNTARKSSLIAEDKLRLGLDSDASDEEYHFAKKEDYNQQWRQKRSEAIGLIRKTYGLNSQQELDVSKSEDSMVIHTSKGPQINPDLISSLGVDQYQQQQRENAETTKGLEVVGAQEDENGILRKRFGKPDAVESTDAKTRERNNFAYRSMLQRKRPALVARYGEGTSEVAQFDADLDATFEPGFDAAEFIKTKGEKPDQYEKSMDIGGKEQRYTIKIAKPSKTPSPTPTP